MDSSYPDLYELRKLQRDNLQLCLQNFTGPMELILDRTVIPMLDRIAGMKFLKDNGVGPVRMLDPAQLEIKSDFDKRLYMLRTDMANIITAIKQIQLDFKFREATKKYQRKVKVVLIPRKTSIIEYTFEQHGVRGLVELDELPIDLIPLDTDILSLEMPHLLPSIFLDRDWTNLHIIAKSIENLINQFGEFGAIHGQGEAAAIVNSLIKTMQTDRKESHRSSIKSSINHLVLIDREVDYVTPLLTQQVYTGILDDWFTIDCGQVTMPADAFEKENDLKHILNTDDRIFKLIRDDHIDKSVKKLTRELKEVKERDNTNLNQLEPEQMKKFVGMLPQHKLDRRNLEIHFNAIEYIFKKQNEFEKAPNLPDVLGGRPPTQKQLTTEELLLDGFDQASCIATIHECIARRYSMASSLRLLCLLSTTLSGIPTKEYNDLKRKFLHVYGYEHLLTFFNLSRVGLLNEDSAGAGRNYLASATLGMLYKKDSFKQLRKKLALIPNEKEDVNHPKSMAYVFGGCYVPLSCRLVENAILGKSFTADEITKHLTGANFSISKAASAKEATMRRSAQEQIALVFFIGGITYSEIAALRFWGARHRVRFIFATTSIINGEKLLSSFSFKN